MAGGSKEQMRDKEKCGVEKEDVRKCEREVGQSTTAKCLITN